MFTRTISSLVSLIIVGLFFCLSFVSAEEFVTPDSGLQISPNRFDLNVSGGQSKEIIINVQNHDEFKRDVIIEIEDFFVADDTMNPSFFVPDNVHPRKTYDVINWISKPENFSLEGKGNKNIHFNINIPEGQPTSGYYGAIFFKTRAPDADVEGENSMGAKLKVNYRVGALVTFAVQGDELIKKDGTVEDFDVIKKVFWQSPITIFTKLHSTGNVHYRVSGEMVINKFGKKFAIVKVDPENLYPDRTRTITEKVIFDSWDFGIYSATLNLSSEDGTIVLQDEIPMFIVIPWKATLMILGIVMFLVIGLKIFKKKFKIVKNEEG